MCALGLLEGPNKKNWTCHQKIFAKGEAILYCMDRYSKMNLLHNTAAACTSLFQRRRGEMEGRGMESIQSSGPGDEGPPLELDPLKAETS